MSVYVDHWRANFRGMIMSHMMADSTEELLRMADKIGVQRKWIQKAGTRWEHFDVCESMRKLAIQHGSIEVTSKDLARLFKDGIKPEPAQGVLI